MKKIIYFLFIALFTVSCIKDKANNKIEDFKVVRTTLNIDYLGGTGIIETNSDNVSAVSSDAWLKVSTSAGKVNLKLDKNDTYSSRTAIVSISSNNQVQTVPITQSGIISIIDVADHDFSPSGGSMEFNWITSEDYEVMISQPWVTYDIRDNKIVFNVAENEIKGVDRQCQVHVKVGKLYDKIVTFNQGSVKLTYEDILGKYKMTYATWHGDGNTPRSTIDAELVENVKGKSFFLTNPDFGFKIVVSYDPDTFSLAINGQPMPFNGINYTLAAFSGYGRGYLHFDYKFGVKAVCEDFNNIVWKFVDNGFRGIEWKEESGKVIIVHGFIIFHQEKQEYTGTKYSRLVDIVLEKVK